MLYFQAKIRREMLRYEVLRDKVVFPRKIIIVIILAKILREINIAKCHLVIMDIIAIKSLVH